MLAKLKENYENVLTTTDRTLNLRKNTTIAIYYNGIKHKITHLTVSPIEIITNSTKRKIQENLCMKEQQTRQILLPAWVRGVYILSF